MAGHSWDGRTHARLGDLHKHSRAITSALGGVARPERAPDSAGCDPLLQPGLCSLGLHTHSFQPPSLSSFNLLKWFLK